MGGIHRHGKMGNLAINIAGVLLQSRMGVQVRLGGEDISDEQIKDCARQVFGEVSGSVSQKGAVY